MSTAVGRISVLTHRLDRLLILGVTLLWTLITVGVFTGHVVLPHGRLLVLAFPAATIAVLILSDGPTARELRPAAAWSTVLAGAFLIAAYAAGSVVISLAIPAALVVAAVGIRRPTAVVVPLFALTAVLGSVQAFMGLKLGALINLMLVGLWISLAVRLATGTRTVRYLVPPAVIACGLYVFLTALEILTAATPSIGFLSFRTSAWYILAFPVVAYAAWSRATYRRLAKWFVVVAVLVAAYAVLRWRIGPSGQEEHLALTQSVLINGELHTVGSFLTGHQLSLWAAFMAPFCLAFALASSGRWRLLAAAGVVLCTFAVFATAVRGPLVGMAVGFVLVVALYGASNAFRLRPGVIVVSVLGVIAVGAAGFALAAGSPGIATRYEQILHPNQDPAYESRERKWSEAIADIRQHPFGQGLGTAGFAQQQRPRYLNVTSLNIDSSYLKIAYEQGFAVMLFFAIAFALLLLKLATGGVRSRDPEIASRAIGAAGALASMLVAFYTGNYIEASPIVAGWIVVGLGLSGLVCIPERAPGADAQPRGERALVRGRSAVASTP